jgi:hypothetical protein
LIFGGADDRQVLGDLWQFGRSGWSRLSRSGPPARTFAAVAYDARRDRFVLFGGNRVLFGDGGTADTLLGDHWEWDGRRWHQIAGPLPPSRTESATAFDPARNRLILFGGWRWADGARVRLDDLWEFDGRSWTQLEGTRPAARSGHAMAWDPISRRIIMVGGNGPRRDVWALDGSGWEPIADLPRPLFNPALAFDRARRQFVLFGGWTGKKRVAETWLFNGSQWRLWQGPGPDARNHSLLVPAGDGSRLILVGGHDGDRVFADQWEWAGRWRPLVTNFPLARLDNGH